MLKIDRIVNMDDELDLKVEEALDIVNDALKDPEFRGKVEAIDNWDYTNLTGKEIWVRLTPKKHIKINIVGKSPWFWWARRVIAYTYKGSSTIYLIKGKVRAMTPQRLAGTLLHEYCHQRGFGHGSNKYKKDCSVPRVLGEMLSSWGIVDGPSEMRFW